MAVPQNKKSASKRGMHRAHDALTAPQLALEPSTGEVHLRHHVEPDWLLSGQEGRQEQKRVASRRRARDVPRHPCGGR